ncbi:MAG: hypothetical protein K2O08_06545 [Clostridia bacterium]|nr:hypothetical protein [Clostridia bacterium]
MCEMKRCTNCKYFRTYNGEERYHCESIGYCINYSVIYNKSSYHIKENIGCDKWEAGKSSVAAERKHIENLLVDIQEKLAQITQLLKETNR